MAVDRSHVVEENVLRLLQILAAAPRAPATGVGFAALSGQDALQLFESQVVARHLDLEARAMKRRDEGYYTIGSAGHEGNVVLGRLIRTSDPSFLHYRSAALMVERARQVPGSTPIMDTLLGVVASKDDPISGGRHKVFGSRALGVPPQTSTIASHLPKAVGCAFSLERAKALRLPVQTPADAIVLCTFGDASVNHASAQTAFNAASWTAFQKLPLPILFVCEDNHIGISVRTPTNWVATRCSSLPHIAYFQGNGLSLPQAYESAKAAVEYVRSRRRPAFLHMDVVRLLGHAGSDVESEYLLREEIEANEARDPLLQTARFLVESGAATGEELLSLYRRTKEQVAAVGREAVQRRKLVSAAEVLEHIVSDQPDAVRALAERVGNHGARCALFGGESELPERSERPRHLAVQMNRALTDALASFPEAMIFGEDVGRKGGVYHVTTDLTRRAGASRVFNTLLDETTILGIALGAAHLGMLPIPEIQYLAYYHNAEDQLRSEACSLQFFSAGQFQNPMVLRIASFGYQKGFGGHFHNDSSTAVLRDLPGIIIAAPARPEDAVQMFRTCLAKAKVDGAVVVFLEPIALYMTKDLYAPKDGLWESLYPAPGTAVPIGKGRLYDESAGDVTIITYANGVYLSLRAAAKLAEQWNIQCRVLDLRWLAPLDHELIVRCAEETGRVVIVDEGRRTGGVSETISALILEQVAARRRVFVRRVTAEDTYIPLGPAAQTVLPSEESIIDAVRKLMEVS